MKSKTHLRRKTLALFVAALFATPSLGQAATLYWDTTMTGLWSNTSNWWTTPGGTINPGTAPGSGDTVVFNGTGVNGNEIVQLNAATSVLGMTFDNTGTTLINSLDTTSRTLTLGGSGITINSGAGAVTLGNATNQMPIAVSTSQSWTNNSSSLFTVVNGISTSTAGVQTLTVGGSGNSTLSGLLANGTGTLALTKNDGGILTLNNATYTGATSVTDGRLILTAANTYRSTTNISSPGVLEVNTAAGQTVGFSYDLTGTGTVVKSGNGTWVLGASGIQVGVKLSAGGLFDIQAGTVQNNFVRNNWTTNLGSVRIANTAVFDIFSENVQMDALIGFGTLQNSYAPNGVKTVTIGAADGSGTFDGVISNIGGNIALIKLGIGTQTLNGANTFSGDTTVSAGKLQLGNTLALQNTAATVNVANGITFSTGITNATLGSLAGTGNIALADVTSNAVALTVGNNNATTTYSGALSDSGSLIKNGTGTMILSGTNTYTGGTAVNAGTLTYLNTNAMPAAGSTTVAASATLGLGVGTASGFFNSADVDSLFAGTMTNVTNNATSNVGIDTTAGNFTYPSSVPSTTRGLVKLGNNALTLSGTNAYMGGTNVTTGTLQFAKLTSNSATGVVAVGTGATLAVNLGGTGEWTTGTSGVGTIGGLLAGLGGQTGATVTYTGNVALGFDTTNNGGGTSTYSNAIGNVGTTLGITKLGTNKLALTGVNTFTGNTVISAGTLQIGGAGSLGAAGTYAGTIAIGTGGTFQYSSSAAQTLSGAITGLGGLTKDTNASVLTLSNATYTGVTTVSTGTLKLTGSGFNSATTVASGATLNLANAGNIGYGAGATITLNSGALTHTGTGYHTNGGLLTTTGTSSIAVTNSGASNQLFLDGGLSGSGTLNITGTGAASTGVHFRNAGGSFAGAVNVLGGQVAVGNNATPFVNADLTLNSTATLHLGTASHMTPTGASVKSLNGAGTVTAAGSTTTLTVGTNNGSGSFSGILTNGVGGALSLSKVGTGTQTISGANAYGGITTVNAGTLNLDYSTQNNSKLSDTSALALGGGILNLTGGSHIETVGSTTLTAGTRSFVTRTSGTSVLQMNAITRNAGASIDFGASNIATTDTLNTNGILGDWATVGGSDWAMNSTNTADGLITAFSGYTDVTRLNSGLQTIADAAANNVRIIEGTGSAADITLGAATTTINTLNQSTEGGTSAATIDPAGQTLVVNSILVGSGAGALTIGNGTNNGTLKTANVASGGELILNNQSASVLTINSAIVNNNTLPSALTKLGSGTATLTGVNTYTGATTIYDGMLQVTNGGSVSTTSAVTMSGGTLQVATGSSVSTNQVITVGGGIAAGNLSINGGSVSTSLNTFAFYIGNGSAGAFNISAGSLNVSGAASGIVLGNNGTAQWTQTGGAVTLAGNAGFYTGNNLGGNSVMDISGGTLTANASNFQFGQRADSTLNLSNSAVVTFNALQSGGSAPSNNVINFGDGVNFSGGANIAAGGTSGKLIIGAMTRSNGTLTLNFNGGTLQAKAASAAYLGTSTVTVQDAGGVIDNGGFAITLAPAMAHGGVAATDGGLIFKGSGITSLSGTNTYNGGTSVTAGTLTFLNTNAKASSGTHAFSAGTTLGLGVATTGAFFTSTDIDNAFSGTMTGNLSNVTVTATTNVGIDTSAGNFTYANDIAGSPTKGLTKLGANTLVLSGANTYTGGTFLNQGVIGLTHTGAGYAINGDFTGNNVTSPDVYATEDNQFAPGAVMYFSGNTGDHVRFELLGTTQTLAGIDNTGAGGRGVIQHREQVTVAAVDANSLLVIDGATGNYTYNGYLRNSGGNLALTKNGANTQTLAGVNITYSGATTVNDGRLVLQDTSVFASNITNTAAVEFNTTAGFALGNGRTLSGSGDWYKTGAGRTTLYNSTVNLSGDIFVQEGTLSNDGNSVNWSGSTANVDISSGAILDLYADAIRIDKLTGTGFVQNNYGNSSGETGSADFYEKLTVGVANGSSTFDGIIRNKSGAGAPAANTSGGGVDLEKVGTGTLTLTGTNTYTGRTTVNGGILTISGSPTGVSAMNVIGGVLDLDYTTLNTTKIADTAALTLGGGTLNLTGGTHLEIVASTTLTANTLSFVTRTSGSSVLQMNAITRNAGASIDFAAANIATTDTLNTNGILGGWATVGGSDWATNSTNAADGLVTAYTAYTDVTRLNSGTQVIADGSTTNVRIIEGTGSAADITLGAGTTTINTLNQSASGGTSAATINPNNQTLAVSGILVGSGAGGLTIGNGANNGTLQAATSGGDLLLNNLSANDLTINSVIGATGASTLTKVGTGTVILNGINTYTGATSIGTGGTLQIGSAGQLGSGTYGGAIVNNGTLQFSSSAAQTLSGVISGAGSLVKDTNNSVLTLTAANTFTGPTTINTGTLTLGTNGRLHGSNSVTIASGATLNLSGNGNNQLAQSVTNGTLTINGTLNATTNVANTLSNGSTYFANISMNNGTLNTSVANTTVWGAFLINSSRAITATGTNTISGTGVIGIANGQVLTLSPTDAVDVINVTGTIGQGTSGTAGGITKSGAGLVTLTGANTYTGPTTISAGSLQLGNGGSTGSLAPASTITNNGNLTINRSVATVQGTDFSTAAISGTGSFTQAGSGTTTLTTNTYTGTTTVSGGQLTITGSIANNGPQSVLMAAPDADFSNGPANPIISRRVLAASSYTLGSATGQGSTAVSSDPLTTGTTASIIAGTASTQTDVTMQWRSRSALEEGVVITNPVLSDVINLNGTGSDLFVLQMSYNAAALNAANINENMSALSGELRLGWKSGTGWVTAVDGNVGGTKTFAGTTDWNTYYLDQSNVDDGTDLASFLGTYGVDPANNNVWAVLNHNSEFAVIPEPSTLVLGSLFGLGLAVYGLRRHRQV